MKLAKLIDHGVTHLVTLWEYLIFTLLFWTIVPIILILATPLYILRFLTIKCFVKILHPDWISPMDVRDVFISEDMTKSKLTSVTTFLFTLEGPPPSVDDFCGRFETILATENYDKFKYFSEAWLGFLFWKLDKNFDLAQHIRLVDDPHVKFCDLEEILSPILTKPFPRDKSPWEVLIFPDLNYPNLKSHLIFRFHHTLSDGFSFFNLICRHFAGIENMADIPQPPVEQKLSFFGHVTQFLHSAVMAGYIQTKYFVLNREWPHWHPSSRQLSGDTHAILVTPDPIKFSELRDLSKKFEVSPTAILFSAIAGGIEKYLKRSWKLDHEIPETIRGHFPWPREGHPMKGLANHWTFVSMKFVLKSTNFLSRLREMGKNFEEIKSSAMPRLTWSFMPLYTSLPTWLMGVIGFNRSSTLTLSSFPGPKNKLVFLDKFLVQDMMFFLPRLRGNPSMQVGILSYNGNIRVTLAVDKALFGERDELKIFCESIQQELKSIQLCMGQ